MWPYLLLACAADSTSGDYQIELGPVASDCATPPEPDADMTWEFVLNEHHPDRLEFGASRERCPLDADGFACEMDDLDVDAPYGEAGLDAYLRVDTTLTGRWRDREHLVGALSQAVTCTGADCEAVAGISPETCVSQWDWTGTLVDHGSYTLDIDEEPLGVIFSGSAPWDPIWIGDDPYERSNPSEALVLVTAQDGVPISLEPVVMEPYIYSSNLMYRPATEPIDTTFGIAGGWDGTEHALLEVPRWLGGAVQQSVGHHGRDPAFLPEDALGRWELNPRSAFANGNTGVGSVAVSLLPPLHLEVVAAEVGAAVLRIVAENSDGVECVLLEDGATLGAGGELDWSRDRIEARTAPAPVVLYAPWLRIGFEAGGTEAVGGEISAIVDVRATAGTNTDVCTLVTCLPCADDGNPSCVAVAGFHWTATRTEEPIDDTLPVCGADFTDTGAFPDTSFDVDCGDSGWECIGASLLVVAPLLRRRPARATAKREPDATARESA